MSCWINLFIWIFGNISFVFYLFFFIILQPWNDSLIVTHILGISMKTINVIPRFKFRYTQYKNNMSFGAVTKNINNSITPHIITINIFGQASLIQAPQWTDVRYVTTESHLTVTHVIPYNVSFPTTLCFFIHHPGCLTARWQGV